MVILRSGDGRRPRSILDDIGPSAQILFIAQKSADELRNRLSTGQDRKGGVAED